MRRRTIRYALSVPLLAALLTAGVLAAAAGEPVEKGTPSYTVNWSAFSNGGTNSLEAGSYRLKSTVGQPVAGLVDAGSLAVQAGFQVGSDSAALFTDGFESGNTSMWSATAQ